MVRLRAIESFVASITRDTQYDAKVFLRASSLRFSVETFDVCDLRKWEIIRNKYQLDLAKLTSIRKTIAAVILDYPRRFISA